MAGPWWSRAIAGFVPQARRYVGARFPAIRHLHEDLIAESVISITESLKSKVKGYPPSWFADTEPESEDDIERFSKFAFTVLKRRLVDHFRSAAFHFTEDVDELTGSQEPLSSDESVDRLVDLKRRTAAVLDALNHMPEQDRQLIQRVALGGDDGPLSDRDRQRLRRLRIELVDRLRSRLGPSALDCIRRL